MARPTPAVLRAASILNLLASHPNQRFTLTDIFKALKYNRATLHCSLAALEESGFLYRASDRSYMLGPSLMRIARVAKEKVSPLQAALPEMHLLANEYDGVCSAVFKQRDEAVVQERAASAQYLDWAAAPNRPYPMKPPIGAVFMAWATPAEVSRWLKKLGPTTTAQRDRELATLEYPRRHGYAYGLRKLENISWHDFESSTMRVTNATEFHVDELEPNQKYPVAFLAAPVFDENGHVAFALVLTGLHKASTGRQFDKIGLALRAACDRITRAIGGQFPAGTEPAPPMAKKRGRPRKVVEAA